MWKLFILYFTLIKASNNRVCHIKQNTTITYTTVKVENILASFLYWIKYTVIIYVNQSSVIKVTDEFFLDSIRHQILKYQNRSNNFILSFLVSTINIFICNSLIDFFVCFNPNCSFVWQHLSYMNMHFFSRCTDISQI